MDPFSPGKFGFFTSPRVRDGRHWHVHASSSITENIVPGFGRIFLDVWELVAAVPGAVWTCDGR